MEAKTKKVKDGDMLNVSLEALGELMAATKMYGPMNSAHEGYGVLLEEMDELWDEVRAKQGARSKEQMRKEAIQVAAMAMRFVIDICDAERHDV